MFIRIFALLLFGTILHGEEVFEPLLAEPAQAHRAAVDALSAARRTKLAEQRAAYLQQLDAALAVAKTSNDTAAEAALRREREGIAMGLVAPANPKDLPKDIEGARRAFFNGAGKASLDFAAARKKLDDEYLKALAKLSAKAKGNKTLATQVAAEKRRVLKGEP